MTNHTSIDSFGSWVVQNIDFPAVILIVLLLLGLWVLWRTQRDPNNDFAFEDMLRDTDGKPSAYRLAVFVCLAVSTWAVMYMAIATSGKMDTWIFAWYITVWSGAKVAEKGIDAYASRQTNQNGSYNQANSYGQNTSYNQNSSNMSNLYSQTDSPNYVPATSSASSLDSDVPYSDGDQGGLRNALPPDYSTTPTGNASRSGQR